MAIGNLADLLKKYPATQPPPPVVVASNLIAYREVSSGSTLGETLIDASFPLQPVTIHVGARLRANTSTGGVAAYMWVTWARGGIRHRIVVDSVPAQAFTVMADYVKVEFLFPGGATGSWYAAVVAIPNFNSAQAIDAPRVTLTAAPALGGSTTIFLGDPIAAIGTFQGTMDMELLRRVWVFRQTPTQTGFLDLQTFATTYRVPLLASPANPPMIGPIELPGGIYNLIPGNDVGQNQGNIALLCEYGISL